MKIHFLFPVIVFTAITFPIYSMIKKGISKPELIVKKVKQKSQCCNIYRGESGNARITSICQKQNSTIINIKILIATTPCANVDSISMTDNIGKSYKPITIFGISNCPNYKEVKQGHELFFEFERLDKGITTINVQEIEDTLPPEVRNWNHWKWNSISVEHCKL